MRREHSIVDELFRGSVMYYMLDSLTWAIGALIDGAIIGNFLGVDAVAAYGLTAPLTLVCALIGSVVFGGSRTLYAWLAGRGETEEANRVFTLSCVLAAGLSLVMTGAIFLLLTPLSALLGAGGEHMALRPLVKRYIAGFILGAPFDSTAKVLAGFLSVDSDDNRVTAATAAMTVTDIVGDLAAVFLFHGGMFLVGLTTALGQIVYFIVLTTHFRRRNRMLKFVVKGIARPWRTFGTILRHGVPAGISLIADALCGIAVNRILSASASSMYLAAYSVHRSMGSLIGATYLGIADTVWGLSGIYYGEEDRRALDRLQKTAVRTGAALIVLAGALLLVFPRFFAGLYIGWNDPEALALSARAVRWFALSMPLYLPVYLFNDYLMGIGRFRVSNVYTAFLECGAVVPVVFVMVRLIGGAGAWIATPVSLVVMLLFALVYVLFWKGGDRFDEKRLLVPRDFGIAAGEELSISADTMTEVVGMSRIAGLFCRENGIDRKKANALALCIEEMGRNIIEHGFTDGKEHSIDIRILLKDGELILRIRDDCLPFNPVERYELIRQQEEDPTKNIGLRLVVNMCRDMQYLSALGINSLIIRI
jgi:Na+-driven multidrug efflux pump/anti-sigma regulatory factor (Ser/Thr protein kinase)